MRARVKNFRDFLDLVPVYYLWNAIRDAVTVKGEFSEKLNFILLFCTFGYKINLYYVLHGSIENVIALRKIIMYTLKNKFKIVYIFIIIFFFIFELIIHIQINELKTIITKKSILICFSNFQLSFI